MKIGRNSPCPCGSGKKVKRCCGTHKAQPDSPEHHYSLGNALLGQGKYLEAITHYKYALSTKPHFSEAHNNLGLAYKEQGLTDKAISCYEKALECRYGNAIAHYNLGSALKDIGKFPEAKLHLDEAINLDPEYIPAYNNRGILLQEQGKSYEAIQDYQKALSINPDFVDAHVNLGVAQYVLGNIDGAIARYKKAISIDPSRFLVHSNLLIAMNCMPNLSATDVYAEHKKYARKFELPLLRLIQPHQNNQTLERRLRIGYLSPDFRKHSVAYFIEPVFRNHDKQDYEIFCYYCNTARDSITRRLRSLVDHWINVSGGSDEMVAQQIRNDRIDILVDLAGHTANNRLPVFARKPAPLQVSWLGYLNTTGLSGMDYRLTDSSANTPGATDAYHTEELYRLPHSQWCYQPPQNAPYITSLPMLTNGYITFASLHILAKVTPFIIDLWSKILSAVPKARLLIVASGLEQQDERDRLSARFEQNGVDTGQLEYHGYRSFEDYLELHNKIDVNLDVFPYTGGTTTCHSLWMGVPVITMVGEPVISRGGASLLSVLGLDELVASSPEEYVEIAVRLAGNSERISKLRSALRPMMTTSPLTDAQLFTRNLEHAYRTMWEKWCTTTH